MGWILLGFWVMMLVVLMVLADTAYLDARAREIGEKLDKDMGRTPCEDCK